MSDTDVRGLQDLPLEELVACHECDLLMRREPLGPGEKATVRAAVSSWPRIAINGNAVASRWF